MMSTRRSHRAGIALILGAVLLAASLATEFIGLEWWSSVDLKRLQQTYLILTRGQIHVGVRGTAGFFSRRIPPPGAAMLWPRTFDAEPVLNRVWPHRIQQPQNSGVSIPVAPVAVVIGAAAAILYARNRPAPGRCPKCSYSLQGLRGGTCPECGTLLST